MLSSKKSGLDINKRRISEYCLNKMHISCQKDSVMLNGENLKALPLKTGRREDPQYY